MRPDAAAVNAATKAGRARAEAELLAPLEATYSRLIRSAGRRSAASFRSQCALVAAVDPKWAPPPGDLVDAAKLTDDARRKTEAQHQRILRVVTGVDELGVSYEVTHPLSASLLASVASRLDALDAALRLQVSETIQQGYEQGWSVDRTSDAIVEKVDDVTPGRAALYARTDLNSLSNGGSLLAARLVDGGEGLLTKTWLTAEDDLVRPDHADADGQTVPVDQPFDVGGEQAMYPGDPDLSDEEAFNCRCTLTYGDAVTASAAPSELAGMVPFRVEVPQQRAPIVKNTVRAPIVNVTNDVAPPDLSVLLPFLEQVGPLIAAAVVEGQRPELVEMLEAVRASLGREFPVPRVVVAAADVAAPDLTAIGPSIAGVIGPIFAEILVRLDAILAVVKNAPTKMVVDYDRAGEIISLRLVDG